MQNYPVTPPSTPQTQVSREIAELSLVLDENEKLTSEIDATFVRVLRDRIPEPLSTDKPVEEEPLVELAETIRSLTKTARQTRRTLQSILSRREV